MVKVIEAIIECCYHDPQIQEDCKKLVDYMPKRPEMVLNNHGGHIHY